MKLNKKQLDVFYRLVTRGQNIGTFWGLVLGQDYDFAYELKDMEVWNRRELAQFKSSRDDLCAVLRQLADAVDAVEFKLDPENPKNALPTKKTEKKAKK